MKYLDLHRRARQARAVTGAPPPPQQRKLDQPISNPSPDRLLLRDYVSNRSTHWARDEGATNGSAKYCVSRATLSPLNSMMLTV